MLISNLWVDTGLVNGVIGTFSAICYQTGGPPDLPLLLAIFYRYHLKWHGLWPFINHKDADYRGKLGRSDTYA